MSSVPPGFLADARSAVGDAHVLTEPDDVASYTVDWTGRWVGTSPAVVRPGSTPEVAALVGAARAHQVALVPQGGNTGLVGGAVPAGGEVVVSLRRLDDLGPVDMLAGQVTAGAGAALSALQDHAAAAGLAFGVDLAARGTATVGGMVATNAGGLHVLRYGSMRAQITGIEAVLGEGQVVSRLSGLVKDNTGYDLAQLLCGSEGTLGIVTSVRLQLVPAPGELVVALLALPSVDEAVSLASALRWRLPGVRALEMMVGEGLRRVAARVDVPPPVQPQAAAFLLVELEADPSGAEAAAERLAAESQVGAGGGAGPLDAAVAIGRRDRARLWRLREEHSDAAVGLAKEAGGVVAKLDVTLPTAELAPFCDEVGRLVERRWPGSALLLFGHVGDGNVHVNVVPPAGVDAAGVDDAVLEQVVSRGGSISAEHGIGVAKKHWLVRGRSEGEVAAMRAIKAALDPAGVLNPNVLLPPAV